MKWLGCKKSYKKLSLCFMILDLGTDYLQCKHSIWEKRRVFTRSDTLSDPSEKTAIADQGGLSYGVNVLPLVCLIRLHFTRFYNLIVTELID